ncbi:MAG: PEP-CTERM sorting domain-containing protein [Planctomycetota bacterium]
MFESSRSSVSFLGTGLLVTAFATGSASAVTVFDDSFADGDLAKTGALDTNWWTSSSSSGIEIAPNALGLVTGSSGRGIHTVFATQTLANIGDKLTATYTFTTPATVGSGSSSAFRVGLFDTLGRAGLDANVSASSSSPNDLYGNVANSVAGLPGYMFDMDVNTGSDDINFREHNVGSATGRLMATTGSSSFSNISPSGPDGVYSFAANTQYTGSFSIERISATEVELTGTIGGATHTVTDVFDSAEIGMLAFHANSNQFGSSNSAGDPDNGLTFSNINVEFIPEPASMSLLALGGLAMLRRRG